MSAMLAQRRRAAAAMAAALAVMAGASAYAVSEKGGGLTYGEVDAEDEALAVEAPLELAELRVQLRRA